MTAYEARHYKDLRLPSQSIAYVIFISYLLCALGEAVAVSWTDPDLPVIHGASNANGTGTVNQNARSRAVIVLAAQHAGYKKFPGFLTGCMMFSALSAANTYLYLSSRILHGLTRNIQSNTWPLSWLKHLGTVIPTTGVPGWALVISAISFYWVPFLQLTQGYTIQDVSERFYIPKLR
jgi:amino acid transporter